MIELTVKVSKIISADIDRTFDAWLDPAMLPTFVLPKPGMPHPRVKVDPREGGAYEILMQVGEDEIPHHGVYKKIVRPKMIVFTWNSPFSAKDSLVTIEFKPVDGDHTEVTLVHEKFPDQESCENHRVGWTNILDTLGQTMS